MPVSLICQVSLTSTFSDLASVWVGSDPTQRNSVCRCFHIEGTLVPLLN